MLQGFLATDLQNVWNRAEWPELKGGPVAVTVGTVNPRQFSKNEGNGISGNPQEMGDILGVYDADPTQTTKYRDIGFEEIDGAVRIDENLGQVFVEYALPYPDLMAITDPVALAATTIPQRFRNFLAARAAGLLLKADGQDASAGALLGLAENALGQELQRIVIPERRNRPRTRIGYARPLQPA